MKPLVVMAVFNRMAETREMLRALEATTDLSEVEVIIVDNASTDGAQDVVSDWVAHVGKQIKLLQLEENIGCPRALNLALAARKAGQAVVKLDNDVRITTSGWVEDMVWIEKNYDHRVAMIGAYYDDVLGGRVLECAPCTHKGHRIWTMGHIIGHAVYHSGAFMDAVGYFDVLADDHLYGFEDLIMSHKAGRLRWEMLIWEGWRIENLQRHNSLGSKRDEHVERMRPLYNQRVRTGSIMTGSDGRPTLEYAIRGDCNG